MAKVYIYADVNDILDSFEGIVVRTPQEYVDSYKAIQEAIYADKEIKVLVKNRYCLACFNIMQKNYGEECIELSIYSPRSEFFKWYGISVPDYISDVDIVDSGILKPKDSLHVAAGMSFESVIMAHYIADEFAFEKFPVQKLFLILGALKFDLIGENRKNNLVNKTFMHRVKCWKDNAHEAWLENMIDSFVSSPQQLYNALCQYILVKKYPIEISRAVVGDIAVDFGKAGFSDTNSYSDGLDYSLLRKEIEMFLHAQPVQELEYEEINDLVEMVSGYFVEEFEFVLMLFKQNTTLIDSKLLQKTLHKFRPMEQFRPDYDEQLNQIIPPITPSVPDATFDLPAWLKWSKQEYLPYRFWLEENNLVNESVDSYSAAYGDWIYAHYEYLLSSGESMLYKTISILKNELVENELSLIVIIDNFNYKYVELLKDFFLAKNYQNVDEKPLLAMLPTVTEVSKQSIFTGQAYAGKQEKSYENEVKKWGKMLNKSMKYLGKVGDLAALNSKQEDIIFLNYLEIDVILHKSQNDSASSTRSKVKNELSALCQQIAAFAKRVGYENKIKVYVVSDHGSTKIVAEQENMIEQSYYAGKADKLDRRYAVIADKNMDQLHSGIDKYCYMVDKNRFGTKENYLIARNYYRFKDTDEGFYVHGGITPEEQIVPLLKFELIDVVVDDIVISLISHEFRLSVKSKLQLLIKNTNQYAITNLSIQILNTDIRAISKSIEVDKVDKLSVSEVSLDNIRFVKNDASETVLALRTAYKVLGQQYQVDFNLPIVIKSIQQNTMNFEDMF